MHPQLRPALREHLSLLLRLLFPRPLPLLRKQALQPTREERALFPAADDALLDYNDDDGFPVEPEFYVPVVPLALVNGCDGIGKEPLCLIHAQGVVRVGACADPEAGGWSKVVV